MFRLRMERFLKPSLHHTPLDGFYDKQVTLDYTLAFPHEGVDKIHDPLTGPAEDIYTKTTPGVSPDPVSVKESFQHILSNGCLWEPETSGANNEYLALRDSQIDGGQRVLSARLPIDLETNVYQSIIRNLNGLKRRIRVKFRTNGLSTDSDLQTQWFIFLFTQSGINHYPAGTATGKGLYLHILGEDDTGNVSLRYDDGSTDTSLLSKRIVLSTETFQYIDFYFDGKWVWLISEDIVNGFGVMMQHQIDNTKKAYLADKTYVGLGIKCNNDEDLGSIGEFSDLKIDNGDTSSSVEIKVNENTILPIKHIGPNNPIQLNNLHLRCGKNKAVSLSSLGLFNIKGTYSIRYRIK